MCKYPVICPLLLFTFLKPRKDIQKHQIEEILSLFVEILSHFHNLAKDFSFPQHSIMQMM
jgi:hypothetical protein